MSMKLKVFRFEGQVTATNAGELKRQITEMLGGEACILALDLSRVDYMDSAGLGVVVTAFKNAQKLGGTLRVHQPQERVRNLFFMTHMDRVFEIVDSPIVVDSVG